MNNIEKIQRCGLSHQEARKILDLVLDEVIGRVLNVGLSAHDSAAVVEAIEKARVEG